ncbi:hypothetical protein EXN22_16390 [Pseudomonas tructae]|uniref:Uncharacterized protein n=1 Tax=Pseudomonas tructae TaxID=2518644 RepID=A0A411MK52_9PSED|nr:hypothetical protein [Pseudomonas tructae]QBF27194.1 hypothetical protein EXN22_16390 [Pseudomonas tructae]
MNQTAKAALDRARHPTPVPVINRVMLLEGKRDATELVFGMRDELKLPGGVAKVLAKLRALAEGRDRHRHRPAGEPAMTALRRKPVIRGCPMRPLDLPALCDICEKPRNRGNHTKCSAIRQQRAQENGNEQK